MFFAQYENHTEEGWPFIPVAGKPILATTALYVLVAVIRCGWLSKIQRVTDNLHLFMMLHRGM
jgi:hypothetical protein